jgi:hypothetical protein
MGEHKLMSLFGIVSQNRKYYCQHLTASAADKSYV